ncbi:MAG: ABC transporter ATP-binding protein [Desulfotomaculaceae bacterium]|nr:ABC transporter ATP-binding protein [Desulfotomaculaceae bacterium]
MAGVNITGVSKSYTIEGHPFFALEDINLFIEDGTFTAIVGKSGCGKTTLLRLLCGLEERTTGKIAFTFKGDPLQVSSSRVGIVFQEPRLMPWLTVKENIAFSLNREREQNNKKEMVDKYLQVLGLERFKAAYPSQISGGMAQRAALGRALCYDPDLILMDEPFGALDYFTRKNLQNEIMNIFLAQGKTIVLVTHDVEEAVFLSQKVIVLDGGKTAGEFTIDLPYPRKNTSSEFLAVRESIYDAIMGIETGV